MEKRHYSQPVTKTLSIDVNGKVCAAAMLEASEVIYAGPEPESLIQ